MLKKFSDIYLNLPIRFKILVWIVPLLLLTISTIGIFSYYIAQDQIINKITDSQNNLAEQTNQQLEQLARDTLDFTHYLFLLSSVQRFLKPTEDDALSRRRQINEIVSSLMINHHAIQSMILYSYDDEVPPLAINQTGLTSTMNFNQFRQTEHYSLAVDKAGKPSWTILNRNEQLFFGDIHPKLLLTRVIKDSYTLHDIGLLIIGINASTLRENYITHLETDQQMFILEENNQVITATELHWTGNHLRDIPYFTFKNESSTNQSFRADTHPAVTVADPYDLVANLIPADEEWLLSVAESETTKWKTVVIQPKNALLSELSHIGTITVLVTAICFLLSIMFSWYVSSFITKPLSKLVQSMNQVQKGNFNQKVDFKGHDEIGELGRGYDQMVHRTKSLIEDVYKTQLKQREAELKSLQAQINPHFLYNTLDSIFWMAQKKKENEISEMIYSLSQVFRLSLNDGEDFIPIEQEIQLVENYLILQQNRFKNKFTYEIHAQPKLKQLTIPKLIIQPLVENSVIHGIESLEKDDQGLVQIKIFRNKSSIVITVIDNGIGLAPERLLQIKEVLQKEQTDARTRTGFAINNINERLKLAYDNQAKLYFESSQGIGTKVEMHFPLKRGIKHV